MSSELQKGDWVNSVLKGTVGASFVSSARDAGLTSTEINAVIKAMQWQMDFRKLKKGDEFSVLMSREMLDGKREQSQLLACVFALTVRITMPSAPKTANSTTATGRVWRRALCASQRRVSSASPLTLIRVV
ncbi:cell wall endopeptidase [Klebsiella pneumoniae]|uniref:Cell wall endopeptidase n=1 Tax=Klebsiella pneumoniae TaxID=573 RepID=A0A377TVC9_KLEPN|nr:cell wall endopeptidase [Klebsiella pneumoniae]